MAQSRQIPKLADLLSSVVGTHKLPVMDQVRVAKNLSAELVAQTFVNEYVRSGFDPVAAYRSVRNVKTRHFAEIMGARWLRNWRVRGKLQTMLNQSTQEAHTSLTYALAQARAQAESNMFDFLTIDESGAVKFKMDPRELTVQQQLNVRGIKIGDKSGRITSITLPDRTAATGLILKALIEIAKTSGGEKQLGRSLAKSLARAKELQAEQAKRLPRPPNVYDMQVVPKK